MPLFLLIFILIPVAVLADEDLLVVTPSTQNILEQIDPNVAKALDKRIEALQAPLEPARAAPPPLPEMPEGKVQFSEIADFQLILEFTGDSVTLSEAQQHTLLQKILPRAKAFRNTRLELKSFGTAENNNKSRRIALSRGLAIRDFLTAQDLSYRRFDILPRHGEASSNRVEIMLKPL